MIQNKNTIAWEQRRPPSHTGQLLANRLQTRRSERNSERPTLTTVLDNNESAAALLAGALYLSAVPKTCQITPDCSDWVSFERKADSPNC
jgi:hypothetical protein